MSLTLADRRQDSATGTIHREQVGRCIHLTPDRAAISQFLDRTNDIALEDLDLVPYKRFTCANEMLKVFGKDVVANLRSVLDDYETGCLILAFGDGHTKAEAIRIATAIGHLISKPISEPSGAYYGVTTVIHDEAPKLKILDPYRTFALHTDGVFADNPVDWLMMMKIEEASARGGDTRLLHIADFDAFDKLKAEPDGDTVFSFGLEQKDRRYEIFSKVSDMQPGRSRLLEEVDGQRRVKFVDQFILPRTLREAAYVGEVQEALERSPGVVEMPLAVGSMVIVNNRIWLHGRAPFERDAALKRTLLRQYGHFS